MAQKISKIRITLFITLGIFCLPFFSWAKIETLGQLYWSESYTASNSGQPTPPYSWGSKLVNKFTTADTLTANLGFSLDIDSSDVFIFRDNGPLIISLSNSMSEWYTGATFASTPIIKFNNEWSWIGKPIANPTAQNPRGGATCCSWSPSACGNYTDSNFIAFNCKRNSVKATSTNPSVATVALQGEKSANKIDIGSEITNYTNLYSTGGSEVYSQVLSYTNPNAFYYPESQQINITPIKNGTSKVIINTEYACRGSVADSYCAYKHVPGVWEYLNYRNDIKDIPEKTITLSKTLNITVSDNHLPTATIDISPVIVYNNSNGRIDDITATINATDQDGDAITAYEFQWYKILPTNPSNPIFIDNGVFNTNASGTVQTLTAYQSLPVGTLIFARGRAKDSQNMWGTYVQSANVKVENLPLIISCSVSPDSVNINEDVTWRVVNVSGGNGGPYYYSWSGTGISPAIISSSTANVVIKKYSSTGTYNSDISVSDGLSTTTVACTNTIGGGVKVTNNGKCNPLTNNQTLTSKPVSNLCLSINGNSNISEFVTGDTEKRVVWRWMCHGAGVGSIGTLCSASLNNTDSSLGCTLSMTNPLNATKVNVNTNTTWLASSTSPGTAIWQIKDSNGTTTPVETDKTLNKIFTNVGLKTITAKIASTTVGVYSSPCIATTTVVQEGGYVREI